MKFPFKCIGLIQCITSDALNPPFFHQQKKNYMILHLILFICFRKRWFRCSTCLLVFFCWELSHVIFLKLRKKELLAKLKKFTKWQTICTQNGPRLSFWVKIVVVLWICSALQAVVSFSAWEKSRDSTPNSKKLEHM